MLGKSQRKQNETGVGKIVKPFVSRECVGIEHEDEGEGEGKVYMKEGR
jgi:hypothetical protein